ncbi:MAG: DUF3786 domain-containing protein [Pseudomonadota bacterium]
MTVKSPIFEETYKNYLAQLKEIDFGSRKKSLGINIDHSAALIPLFGKTYRVSTEGVFDPAGIEPIHAVSVVLCKYLLLCPHSEPLEKNWVSYKDFKDAAPFVGGFVTNTEKALVRHFSGRLDQLKEACLRLGGRPTDLEVSYQLVLRFEALPKISILLLFNDEDEEFPAQGSLLFQKKAAQYLDMECLAVLGWFLTDALIQATGAPHATIM